jgi:iron complex outermembrane receptor protein
MTFIRKTHLLAGISATALSLYCGQAAWAADAVAAAPDSATVSDIIVTGTRQTGVKAADSAAPIELVGSEVLHRTGSIDLASALTASVPSLNIQTTGGDLAALSIQAALRGLSPNDTLVLVDGKRRHTTSNLAIDGGSAYSGAATTDLSFIPTAAIDHIEVLTDGAAAQYGTDAIAGVVNIILKKADHGGALSATGGANYDGQGGTGAVSFNKGFALGDRGFFNVTLEQRYHDLTVQGIGDGRLQNPNGSPLAGLTFPSSNVVNAPGYPHENGLNGDPKYNLYNGFFNAGFDLGHGVNFYSFGSYGDRTAQHYENYRVPDKVQGVTSTGETVFPLPNGFSPSEKIEEKDYSITGGLKGEVAGWDWDVSTTYGKDDNQIYVVDSANAQLFPVLQAQSPTLVAPQRNFYNGAFATTQLTNTIDIDKTFAVGLASPLNVAFGAEQRRETFSIEAGEPSSYFGAGAQSFDGYTPFDQGDHSRTNYAFYGDVAADLVTGLHVDLAGRYEHFSDFGDTTVGKLTARYDFNPMIAIRGTVSTGFRAPTLAEEYYSGTNVSPTSADVVLPPNSTAATVAGFSSLKPEKSTNYSIGFIAHPIERLQISVDVYEIDLKDRILTSGLIYGTNTIGGQVVTISQGVLNAIAAKGVTIDSGLSYTGISLFANAADTKTQGAEITANYASDFGEVGHVDWTVGVNINQNSITKLAPLPAIVTNVAQAQTSFLTPNAYSALTTATPREKVILQAYWTLSKWDVNLRETIYGPTAQWTADNSFYQQIGTTGITDLEVGYKITPSLKIDLGANNLFNTFPPRLPNQNGFPVGGGLVFNVPYSFAPWGGNGGYYYGRITFTF